MSSLHTRPRPSTGSGFRIGVFDTSVLTTGVTAAVFRGLPSSIVDGMREGTLRGFIPHYVWAEVPRVLADLKREGGAFDLAAAGGRRENDMALQHSCQQRVSTTRQRQQPGQHTCTIDAQTTRTN